MKKTAPKTQAKSLTPKGTSKPKESNVPRKTTPKPPTPKGKAKAVVGIRRGPARGPADQSGPGWIPLDRKQRDGDRSLLHTLFANVGPSVVRSQPDASLVEQLNHWYPAVGDGGDDGFFPGVPVGGDDEQWFAAHDTVGDIVGRPHGGQWTPPAQVSRLFSEVGLRLTSAAVTAFAAAFVAAVGRHMSTRAAITEALTEVGGTDPERNVARPDKFRIAFGASPSPSPAPSFDAWAAGIRKSKPENWREPRHDYADGVPEVFVPSPDNPTGTPSGGTGRYVPADSAFQLLTQRAAKGTAAAVAGPPASMSSVIGPNATHIRALQTPFGEGVHLKGQLVVATMESDTIGGAGLLKKVGDSTVLTPGTANTGVVGVSRPHSVALSPVDWGGRPAAFSALYTRFHVHKATFKYMPATTTTTVQAVAMSVVDDAAYNAMLTVGDGTADSAVLEENLFGVLLANDEAIMGPSWSPMSVGYGMRGNMAELDNWLFTRGITVGAVAYNNVANVLDKRQRSAGTFTACLDRTYSSNYTFGHIVLEYEVIFADPVADLTAFLPSQILLATAPGSCEFLGHNIANNPEPFFRLLEEYGFRTNLEPKSVMDEEIERYLERVGIRPPPEALSRYDQWLLGRKAPAKKLM